MADCAYGSATGRTFIYDDYNVVLVTSEPDHDEWHLWTEYRDEEGEFTYVSDHEGYALDSEEFGPFTDEDVIWQFKVGDEFADSVGNWLIVDVELGRVRSYDWEGCLDWQSVDDWMSLMIDLEMKPVTEPSLEDRLALWRENGDPNFPL